MATEFKLPDLGENIHSGDVVSLLVKEGDAIKPQQDVIEIETDKAVIPVPCSIGGKVSKIHVKPGQTVKIGEVLLTLEEATKDVVAAESRRPLRPKRRLRNPRKPEPAKPAAAEAARSSRRRETRRFESQLRAAAAGQNQNRPAPAPRAVDPAMAARRPMPPKRSNRAETAKTTLPPKLRLRRLGRPYADWPANLASICRACRHRPRRPHHAEDVIGAVRHATGAATATAPKPAAHDRDAWGPIRREPISKIRKTIAANMVRSAFTIPHLTNFDDADITELERIRKGSVADYAGSNVKLTSLVFVIKAVALSLQAASDAERFARHGNRARSSTRTTCTSASRSTRRAAWSCPCCAMSIE